MSKHIDELTELICDTVRTVFPNASLDDGYDVADEVIAKLPTIEVSEDCISREWLYNELAKVTEVTTVRKNRQVERAEGEWLLDGRCSNCLQAPLTTHKTYCPNCGADMRGEQDE